MKNILTLIVIAFASVAMAHSDLYSANQLVTPLVLKHLNLDHEDLKDAIKFATMEADSVLGIMNSSLR